MSEVKDKEVEETSRRALGAVALGVIGLGYTALKSAPAKASAFGEENATLIAILATVKDTYETAKKYQESFNKYVDGANNAFRFIDKTHSLIDRIKNIDDVIETQRQQLNNVFKNRRAGDWTKFRLKRLDIDSFALVQEIKYFNSSIRSETVRLLKLEQNLKTEEDKEKFNGRRRVLSRVGKSALTIQQGKLFYEASKQNTEARRKAFDSASLDPESAARGVAADSVPEILEILRQMLRQQILTNEQLSTAIEMFGLQKPISSNNDYIMEESDYKRATDLAAEGDFDWTPETERKK